MYSKTMSYHGRDPWHGAHAKNWMYHEENLKLTSSTNCLHNYWFRAKRFIYPYIWCSIYRTRPRVRITGNENDVWWLRQKIMMIMGIHTWTANVCQSRYNWLQRLPCFRTKPTYTSPRSRTPDDTVDDRRFCYWCCCSRINNDMKQSAIARWLIAC